MPRMTAFPFVFLARAVRRDEPWASEGQPCYQCDFTVTLCRQLCPIRSAPTHATARPISFRPILSATGPHGSVAAQALPDEPGPLRRRS